MDDSPEIDGPVLLFDGECGLCQAMVRFVLRRDARGRIRVAALQGETGQGLLRRAGLPTTDFDSLVFFPGRSASGAALRTDGVAAVLGELSPGWGRLGRVIRWIPRPIRDAGYRVVARLRHRLVGDPRPDGLNQPEWSDRILP